MMPGTMNLPVASMVSALAGDDVPDAPVLYHDRDIAEGRRAGAVDQRDVSESRHLRDRAGGRQCDESQEEKNAHNAFP
jgi:hypothetical protein